MSSKHYPLFSRVSRFWLIFALLTFLGLWVFKPILFPFVASLILAYCLDPVCDRLEEKGLSRSAGVGLVIGLFMLVIVLLALVAIVPLVNQGLSLFSVLPTLISNAIAGFRGLILDLQTHLPNLQLFEVDNKLATGAEFIWPAILDYIGKDTIGQLSQNLADSAGSILSITSSILSTIWSGSLVIVNLVSLLFVTPFVAFYLMRDWDKIVATVDSLIPHSHRDDIRKLGRGVDETLAGFLRGQSMVILCMMAYYIICLRLVNLDFWLVVGLIAGLLTFIPFVGAFFGFALSVGLALFQFDSLTPVVVTAGMFLFGQFIEGNFLTPRLVGGRVGLNPAWVMFALLAGGSLFGFTGVLVAVPVAAIIGVMVRFAVEKYRISQFYACEEQVLEQGFEQASPASPTPSD